MTGQQIMGTDTKEFTQVAELQIWVNRDGTKWDLWIDNALYHCYCLNEVMSKLTKWLEKKTHRGGLKNGQKH